MACAITDFGGWQSTPDLLTNATTAALPGISLARDLIEAALESYVRELLGSDAGGEGEVH